MGRGLGEGVPGRGNKVFWAEFCFSFSSVPFLSQNLPAMKSSAQMLCLALNSLTPSTWWPSALCSCRPWYCRAGKIIFPLPFWVPSWDPCNKRHVNKRKINRSLLTYIPHALPRGKWVTPRGGSESRLKYHLNRERGGGCRSLRGE